MSKNYTTKKLSGQELCDLPDGTAVLVVSSYGDFREGEVIYRSRREGISSDCSASCWFTPLLDWTEENYTGDYMTCEEVELIEGVEETLSLGFTAEQGLGVYRPELTTRKAGKIRVELVDDGFPLALREVAKVMTWAQTAKGYKDHDWQNLPDAEVQLAAAASRHRTDMIKQRVVDGLPIDQCVDPESAIIHKAHEAFGVLAQLELMLRGKFD